MKYLLLIVLSLLIGCSKYEARYCEGMSGNIESYNNVLFKEVYSKIKNGKSDELNHTDLIKKYNVDKPFDQAVETGVEILTGSPLAASVIFDDDDFFLKNLSDASVKDKEIAMSVAVEIGDLNKQDLLIASGLDLNRNGSHTVNYLWQAMGSQCEKSLDNLIYKHGINLSAKDKHGKTISYYASASKNKFMMDYLNKVKVEREID